MNIFYSHHIITRIESEKNMKSYVTIGIDNKNNKKKDHVCTKLNVSVQPL